jgi:hypothetical protein
MAKLVRTSKRMLVRRYLIYRRSLGYRMRGAELLLDFARFMDATAPHQPLTTALAIQWASAVPSARPIRMPGGLGWCGDSPATVRRWMHAPRFQIRTCLVLAFNVPAPISLVPPNSE